MTLPLDKLAEHTGLGVRRTYDCADSAAGRTDRGQSRAAVAGTRHKDQSVLVDCLRQHLAYTPACMARAYNKL